MRRLASPLLLILGGCFTADLDPTAIGVFACSDESEDACPGDLSCVNGRCEAPDTLPDVVIGFPEVDQELPFEDEVGATRMVNVTVSGTLVLVNEVFGTPHVFGEGHLEVVADDRPPVIVDAGALGGILSVPVVFDNTLGPHRISVRAIRNDGIPYDHGEALANRLFFISDGTTPMLGITRPWPGDAFPLDATTIEVEASVLRFALRPAVENGLPEALTGHLHVYYDRDIDACLADVGGCDNEYLTTIVQEGATGLPTLPDASAGSFPLSLVLRNIDHSLFRFDADPDDDIPGVSIIDEIQIVRR